MNKPRMSTAAQEAALRRLSGSQVSVGELVSALGTEGLSIDDSVAALIALQREKKLTIEERVPYLELVSYVSSPLSLWLWALVCAIALSLALTTTTSGAFLYLRYVFGGILVLFIPGYSLTEALFPERELDDLTRAALAIGLSLALVPLVGLVLNYTPLGIRLAPVAIAVSGTSLVLLFIGLLRRHALYRRARTNLQSRF